jgi:hypothetical protein
MTNTDPSFEASVRLPAAGRCRCELSYATRQQFGKTITRRVHRDDCEFGDIVRAELGC